MTFHKIFSKYMIIFGCCLAANVFAGAAKEVPPALNERIPDLAKLGENTILVAAVKAQNAEGLTLDTIKKRDTEWMAATGVNATMKALMENAAAKELEKIETSQPFYFESFLMDNQGANVAMTNKTSDYWQGDEEKFTESYKGGTGEIFIGEPKFDESAKTYLIQVSVPVKADGKAIGVLTIGVNLDELEAAQ